MFTKLGPLIVVLALGVSVACMADRLRSRSPRILSNEAEGAEMSEVETTLALIRGLPSCVACEEAVIDLESASNWLLSAAVADTPQLQQALANYRQSVNTLRDRSETLANRVGSEYAVIVLDEMLASAPGLTDRWMAEQLLPTEGQN